MGKKILIAVAVVIVAAVGFIASRPGEFVVTRSATIQAPADVVLGQVTDFNQWKAWNPFAKLDPNMKIDIQGAPHTVGATYHWVGNDQAGEGTLTLAAVEPGKRADLKLEFIKPFPSTNATEFTVAPAEGGQTLTWTMKGTHNFMSKAMCIFMDMDKMVGGDFERGLADLKTKAETEAKAVAAAAAAAAQPATAEAGAPAAAAVAP